MKETELNEPQTIIQQTFSVYCQIKISNVKMKRIQKWKTERIN